MLSLILRKSFRGRVLSESEVLLRIWSLKENRIPTLMWTGPIPNTKGASIPPSLSQDSQDQAHTPFPLHIAMLDTQLCSIATVP